MAIVGEPAGTIDLRVFDDDSFVVHFGGELNSVDANTFGNALIGLAETLRAIHQEVNPGHHLTVSIEAVGPGSFRAKLRTAKRSLRNLFSGKSVEAIILAVLASFLWDKVINPDQPPKIIVNTDAVIIEYKDTKVIVSKEAFEAKKKVEKNPQVTRSIVRTIEILEQDPAVKSLGFTPKLSDPTPLIEFPRATFPVIRERTLAPDDDRRYQDIDATLSVLKAVFERSSRKWEFIWNGFRISAPILDQSFFDRLEKREISLQQGDAFDATLRVHQARDRVSGTWVNESYEVLRVGGVIHRAPQDGELGH